MEAKKQLRENLDRTASMFISVRTVLIAIGNDLSRAVPFGTSLRKGSAALRHAYENTISAEALLELIEIEDCGSTGGYSEGQGGGDKTLFRRWLFLVNKYNPELKKADGHDQGIYFAFKALRAYYDPATIFQTRKEKRQFNPKGDARKRAAKVLGRGEELEED